MLNHWVVEFTHFRILNLIICSFLLFNLQICIFILVFVKTINRHFKLTVIVFIYNLHFCIFTWLCIVWFLLFNVIWFFTFSINHWFYIFLCFNLIWLNWTTFRFILFPLFYHLFNFCSLLLVLFNCISNFLFYFIFICSQIFFICKIFRTYSLFLSFYINW